jgi:hypothetical protein
MQFVCAVNRQAAYAQPDHLVIMPIDEGHDIGNLGLEAFDDHHWQALPNRSLPTF